MAGIHIMVEEHTYISRMLKVVRRACLRLLNENEINYEDFDLIVDFIRNYADAHHHRKEELILFNRMMENLGVIGEKIIKNGMLVEHDYGRLYIKDLTEALEKFKSGNEEAKIDIIANSISYTHLLERHIDKENNVIYKFAEKELDSSILKIIDTECSIYEKKNEVLKNKYIAILEKLEKIYI